MFATRLVLGSAALVLACSKAQTPAPADVQQNVALTEVSSCGQLSAIVQDAAVHEMRATLDAYKSGPGIGVAAGLPGPSSAPAPGPTPVSFSTTNTQVAGVDEADFMKNDGTRIFLLSGDSLYAATSWPPADLAATGKLKIEGWPQSMFLDGNTVAVFSAVYVPGPDPGMACPDMVPGGPGGLRPRPTCFDSTLVKVTVVDVTDLHAPKAISEQYLPGYASAARRVGSTVRLIVPDGVHWPKGLKWFPDWDPEFATNHDKFVAAIDALENADEAIIRNTPAQSWFPPGTRKLQDGSVVDVSYQCTDFWVPNAPERLGLLTVATFDLSNPAQPPERTSIFGDPGVVYATAQNLYVASSHWWWWPGPGQKSHTYVHQFDISDPVATTYVASGGVDGWVADQFALDEWNGHLRVAATTWVQPQPDGPAMGLAPRIGNHLAVLERSGKRLAQVGDTDQLVAGESIYATRFVGPSAFVVTFRQIDPLVTVDVSDAAHPKKVAELTLPGFSTYLQPIDDGHLLALGVDLPPPDPVTGTVDGNLRALQLSVFDVSDLAHPARTAQMRVGTMWAWSEASYDHHAFNWYPQRNLLAIPFADWAPNDTQDWYGQFVSDVRAFRVDASGIAALGSLGMRDVYLQGGNGQWSWQYEPWARRSILATDAGGTDYLYAVSDAGIRVGNIADLSHPLATTVFRTPP
jgi:uncharacterized secreted protein with C-terminal beta-propeller domain